MSQTKNGEMMVAVQIALPLLLTNAQTPILCFVDRAT